MGAPAGALATKNLLRTILSFPVLLGACLSAAAFAVARLHVPDSDTWWHLVVGEGILTTGTWPTVDPYSFTVSGHEWIAYEWLGEVVMALATRLSAPGGSASGGGSLSALAGLLIGLSALVMVLVYVYAWLRSGNSKAAFLASALVWPLAAVIFVPRPQLLGYIFLLITLICLEAFRQGRNWTLWLLPLVFLVWVNTHGTFVFGFVVLGAYGVGGLMKFRLGGLAAEPWTPAQRRRLAVVLLLCVLAVTLTPYGTRPAAYPLELALLQPTNVASIAEWQPMPFDLFGGKLFLLLVLAFFALQMFFPLVYRLEEMGLLALTIYAASTHRRFVVFFAIVFAPLLAVQLARWVPRYQPAKDRPLLNAVLIALVVVHLVVFFPTADELKQMVADRFPHGAVEYLREHKITQPMLNEYAWGGYLIWAAGPEHKVFIDGRADLYEYAGVLTDWLDLSRLAPHTPFLLRKYGFGACLLQRDRPLETFLASQPEWEQVYSDELSVLLVRRTPSVANSGRPTAAMAAAALSAANSQAAARQQPF